MQDITQAISIINSNLYINIATVSASGEPWNTPVYAVYDNKLNFYWRSWIKAQHSKNIVDNGKAFITIYDSSRDLGTNHKMCLYIKAKAIEINNVDEVAKILSSFTNNSLKPKDFIGEGNVKRVYKAVPQKAWLNDKSEGQVTKDTLKMRTEVKVPEIIELLKLDN